MGEDWDCLLFESGLLSGMIGDPSEEPLPIIFGLSGMVGDSKLFSLGLLAGTAGNSLAGILFTKLGLSGTDGESFFFFGYAWPIVWQGWRFRR